MTSLPSYLLDSSAGNRVLRNKHLADDFRRRRSWRNVLFVYISLFADDIGNTNFKINGADDVLHNDCCKVIADEIPILYLRVIFADDKYVLEPRANQDI